MTSQTWNRALRRLTWLALTAALALIAAVSSAQDPQEFSDWSSPSTSGADQYALAEIAPSIARDGLALYFVRSAGAGRFGGMDIWVSQQADLGSAWGVPQNLGPTINTPFNEFAPTLSLDGHTLYLASNRLEALTRAHPPHPTHPAWLSPSEPLQQVRGRLQHRGALGGAARDVERGLPALVARVHVGASVRQSLDDWRQTERGGCVERR